MAADSFGPGGIRIRVGGTAALDLEKAFEHARVDRGARVVVEVEAQQSGPIQDASVEVEVAVQDDGLFKVGLRALTTLLAEFAMQVCIEQAG